MSTSASTTESQAKKRRDSGPESAERELQLRSAATLERRDWQYYPNFLQAFTVEKQLGSGAGGQVYIVRRNSDNRLFAAKMMTDSLNWIDNELKTLELLGKHTQCVESGVICYHGHFLIDNPRISGAKIAVILTDYIDGQDLHRYTQEVWDKSGRAPSSMFVRALLRSCLRAFRLIHSLGIAHRDVKPENIMVLHEQARCVLIDFAFSCTNEQCKTIAFAGTPCYTSFARFKQFFTRAPINAERALRIDQAGDMWSLGLAFYQLLTGERNVPCKVSDALDDAQTPLKYSVPVVAKFTEKYALLPHEELALDDEPLSRVMRGLIEPDIEYRLTAQQALDILDGNETADENDDGDDNDDNDAAITDE